MAPHASAPAENIAITDTEGMAPLDPLTWKVPINDIFNRRAKATNAQWGVAASSGVEAFKIHKQDHKTKARRWDRK